MEREMQRTFLAATLLLGTIASAQALTNDRYYDTIRPHGRPRPGAVFQSALNACYAQTGASRYRADMPAFKRCMGRHGYRWMSVRRVRTHYDTPGGVDPFDPIYTDPPAAAPTPPTPQPPPDPMTGMPYPGYGY